MITRNAAAIIPARGGSKRIPRKNILDFCGKPILCYSIEAAIRSKIFDTVMVSTDDEEIARLARSSGAEVPFMRSEETAGDLAATADVIWEVLESYRKMGVLFKIIVCLYPTAPFITSEKLQKAMDMLTDSTADAVIPLVRYSFPPQRSFSIANDRVKIDHPEQFHLRSQDLAPVYHDCGQFYVIRTAAFLEYRNLVTPNTIPMICSDLEVQDIDNLADWKIAEIKYKVLNDNGVNDI